MARFRLMCAPFRHPWHDKSGERGGTAEVAPPVGSERHGLAVDQRLGAVEAGNRLGDPSKAIREIRTASAPES